MWNIFLFPVWVNFTDGWHMCTFIFKFENIWLEFSIFYFFQNLKCFLYIPTNTVFIFISIEYSTDLCWLYTGNLFILYIIICHLALFKCLYLIFFRLTNVSHTHTHTYALNEHIFFVCALHRVYLLYKEKRFLFKCHFLFLLKYWM